VHLLVLRLFYTRILFFSSEPFSNNINDRSTECTDSDAMQRARYANEEGDPGVALVKAVAGRALKSPKVRVGLVLWAVGLFFMLLAPGFTAVTPEMKTTYEGMVVEAANMPEYHEAYAKYTEAQAYADEAKVWFWRFREPYKSMVDQRQPVADKWAAEVARTARA